MRAVIQKSALEGSIIAPPSKSYTHRAIISSLLSTERTTINNHLVCDDTLTSLRLTKMMGASVDTSSRYMHITGPEKLWIREAVFDCRGSGTTLRLFTPLVALADGTCRLTGDQSLLKRPIGDLIAALQQLGIKACSLQNNDRPPVEITSNGIDGGLVEIPGNISSQYISGLLFALSKAKQDSRISITTELESKPYIEMTLEVMNQFGVFANPSSDWKTIEVSGSQKYSGTHYDIPGDYSSAAFLLVAGALTGNVKITGLRCQDRQGDSKIITILEEMGITISQNQQHVMVSKSEPRAIDIDAADIPDLVPILCVLATQAKGRTRIYNAERLQFKESNRLSTTTAELGKLGANLIVTNEGIDIFGPSELHGANINPHDDHRIAMASIVACLVSKHTSEVNNIECINKSYPNFIQDIVSLGAQIECITDRKSGRRNQ